MMTTSLNEPHAVAAAPDSLFVGFNEKLQVDLEVFSRPRTSSSRKKEKDELRNSCHGDNSDNVKEDSTEDARISKKSPRPHRNRSAEKPRRRRESDPLNGTWHGSSGGRRKMTVKRSIEKAPVQTRSFEESDISFDTWNGSFSERIERTTTPDRQINSISEEGNAPSSEASPSTSERENSKRKEDLHRSSSRSRRPHRKSGEESTRRSPRSTSRGERKQRKESDAHKDEEAYSSRSKCTSSRSTSRGGRRRKETEQGEPSSRSRRASCRSTSRGRRPRSGSLGRIQRSSSNNDHCSPEIDGPQVDSCGFPAPERRMRKGTAQRMSYLDDETTDGLFLERMASPEPPKEARSRNRSTSRGRRRNNNEEDEIIPPGPPDSGVMNDFPFCTPDRRMRKGMASRISRSEEGPTDEEAETNPPGPPDSGTLTNYPFRSPERRMSKDTASSLSRSEHSGRLAPGTEHRARSRSTSRGRRSRNSKDNWKRTLSAEDREEDAKRVLETYKEPLYSILQKEDGGLQTKLSSMLGINEAKTTEEKESNGCSLVSFDTIEDWKYIKTAAKLAVLDAERTQTLAKGRGDKMNEERGKPGFELKTPRTKNAKWNLETSLQILETSERSERSGSVMLSPKAASRRFSRRSSLDSQSMSSSICSETPKPEKNRFSRRNSLECSIHSMPSTPSPVIKSNRKYTLAVTTRIPGRESTTNRKIKCIRDEAKTAEDEESNCFKDSCSLVSFDTIEEWAGVAKASGKVAAILDPKRTQKVAKRCGDKMEEAKKPGYELNQPPRTKDTKWNLETRLHILETSEHSERSGSVMLSPKAASRRFSRRSSLDSESLASSICSGTPKSEERRFSRRNSLESSIQSIPTSPSPLVNKLNRTHSLTISSSRRQSTPNRKIKYIRKPDKDDTKATDES